MSRSHLKLDRGRWEHVRREVFRRDRYRCRQCGRAGRLEADHVRPLHRFPDQDPFDPDGIQTLCRACHLQKTALENRRPLTPAEAAWRALVEELTA